MRQSGPSLGILCWCCRGCVYHLTRTRTGSLTGVRSRSTYRGLGYLLRSRCSVNVGPGVTLRRFVRSFALSASPLDVLPFLEGGALSRGGVMLIGSAVDAVLWVGTFVGGPICRTLVRFFWAVFGLVVAPSTICAGRGDYALCWWMASFLAEGTSSIVGVGEDFNVVVFSTEEYGSLFICISFEELFERRFA